MSNVKLEVGKMAPKLDDAGLQILACSVAMQMMMEDARPPAHEGNTHNDVTGYFNRKRRSR
jgi:hypothetical protein